MTLDPTNSHVSIVEKNAGDFNFHVETDAEVRLQIFLTRDIRW